MNFVMYHLIALSLAVVIDRIIGDPRNIPHPVVGIGKMISFFDCKLNGGERKKLKGFFFLLIIISSVFITTVVPVILAYFIHPWIGVIIEAIIISFAIAQRSLKEAAEEVLNPLNTGNIQQARLKLSYIVGRDTENLAESEIIRGTVETVAENTSDGVTAPLFFALIGGAPLAMLYRAVNTCDSMVGYKNEKYIDFGWASAKFDDVLNYIPSRLTGILMILCSGSFANQKKWHCFEILWKDAKKHPSPNSGWGEAAVASLLGIQLGGQNQYKGMISNRAKMGISTMPISSLHIKQAIQIMHNTVLSFVFTLWMIGGVLLWCYLIMGQIRITL
ncbi:adenosylcobinamide-phosphate synthase CbiB [Alkalihalobacterium chitinilyticum]|uniref:Cobalamin biosynthesis protein CobD n=1 Tax=Alkalihalobacterium chitinilyticum TaxID=2980103 RepID=A0ABT5V972_9BACI|nr:adenosylcobinamide-phosphate synthase CbiB [Alkalihalobacterium chitinilyticum]MDE5411995.1 adenosylcobinamide-phosphate synthase CbiB [Alkalihalobacterium chitinilyticum]